MGVVPLPVSLTALGFFSLIQAGEEGVLGYRKTPVGITGPKDELAWLGSKKI